MKKNSINYQPTADNIQKKIETIQKNIILENKKAIPNHKTILNLIDRQMSLENELQAIHNQRNDALIIQKAKQCTYTALKTIFTKTADKQIQQTMYSIWQHSDITDILPLAQELINIASLAIIETWKKSVLSLDSFLELDFYTMAYKQFTTNQKTQSYHTPFTYTLTQVNKFIHSQKSTKGRKTVSQYQTVKQADCFVYDNIGAIKRIETYDAERIAVKQGYAIELISLNALQGNTPENYENLSIQHDIKLDNEYQEEQDKVMKLLGDNEKLVFPFIQEGFSCVEIASILSKKDSYVRKIKQRIKEKIANSGLYDNYDIVREYKTK